jgi:hypothetical protein
MPPLPGFWVHYSAPGSSGGLTSAGAAPTSYGGYVSTTAIPTGSDLSLLFPSYRRFARIDDFADRGYFRCLFAVNNTGAAVIATLAPVLTGDIGGLFLGPIWGFSAQWDTTAASAFASTSPQAGTWQSGPATAAQILAEAGPSVEFGATANIPNGFVRAFWVGHRTGSGFSPTTNSTKSVGATISLTTVPA